MLPKLRGEPLNRALWRRPLFIVKLELELRVPGREELRRAGDANRTFWPLWCLPLDLRMDERQDKRRDGVIMVVDLRRAKKLTTSGSFRLASIL